MAELLKHLSQDVQDDCECPTEGPYDKYGSSVAYLSGETFEFLGMTPGRFVLPMRERPIEDADLIHGLMFLDSHPQDEFSSEKEGVQFDVFGLKHLYYLTRFSGTSVRNLKYHGLFLIPSQIYRKKKK